MWRGAFTRFQSKPKVRIFFQTNKCRMSTNTISSLSTKNGLPYKYIDPTSPPAESSIDAFEMPPDVKLSFIKKGINNLFPIQSSVWAEILDGKDVLARARTGTGKTLAFSLPIISKLYKDKQASAKGAQLKALIIAPTRELATQIFSVVKEFSPKNIYSYACYGGVNINPQLDQLSRGVDILIGTPGRLVDLLQRRALNLDELEYIVLDEADFMLDLGFKAQLETILSSAQSTLKSKGKENPQMLLFSATVPEWVANTAKTYFQRPQKIYVDGIGETTIRTSENIKQVALAFKGNDLENFVSEVLLTFSPSPSFVSLKALVFCDTKRQVAYLTPNLFSRCNKGDSVPVCAALHGDLSQLQRNETLDDFKTGRVNVLVATDVAARGIDIADVDVVVQINPPPMVETFIHRSGRTARAGKGGVSVLVYNPEQHLADLNEIERIAGFKFSRQALEVGRSLTIKDKETFTQVVKNVSTAEKEAVECVVNEFLGSNTASQREIILALTALLHRSFPASFKINRSALTGEQGFITLQFTPKKALNSTHDMILLIDSLISSIPKASSLIAFQRLTFDKKSMVFDVPIETGKAILMQNELSEVSEHGEFIAVHEIPMLSNENLSLSALSRARVAFGSMRAGNTSSPMGHPQFNPRTNRRHHGDFQNHNSGPRKFDYRRSSTNFEKNIGNANGGRPFYQRSKASYRNLPQTDYDLENYI